MAKTVALNQNLKKSVRILNQLNDHLDIKPDSDQQRKIIKQ